MPLPSFLERFRRGAARSASDDVQGASSPDVEAMRARARRRLIGMLVLVGAGVIGFPWLFETQPRPMAGDIQIVQAPQAGTGATQGAAIQGGASAIGVGAITGTTIAAVSTPASSSQRRGWPAPEAPAEASDPRFGAMARTDVAPPEREEIITEAPPRQGAAAPAAPASPAANASKPTPPKAVQPKPLAQAASKASVSKPTDKPGQNDAVGKNDKAPAKPSDKDKKANNDKPATRYVVQFGAFADVNSAHEARMKAERLGLKTYAQQVDTPQGKRIRVRLGPFTDKAEADKAAAALRKASLPGAVLTL